MPGSRGAGSDGAPGSASSAGRDEHGAGSALDDPLGDAPEYPRGELTPAGRAEHDQVSAEGPRLVQDCLGYPVHNRESYVGASREPGHPQVEDGRLGLERCLVPRVSKPKRQPVGNASAE